MIRHYQPRALPASSSPFSPVVIDEHYVHLAGIVAADFPAGLKVLGDVAAETRAVLGVIAEVLAELDLDLGDLVRADVHLADFDDFEAMNAAYRAAFAGHFYPTRTTVEAPRLFGGCRVEITVMARRRQPPRP